MLVFLNENGRLEWPDRPLNSIERMIYGAPAACGLCHAQGLGENGGRVSRFRLERADGCLECRHPEEALTPS